MIGAVAGGPVGFILGAAIGAKVGDNMDKKNDRIAGLQDSFADSYAQLARMERDFDALGFSGSFPNVNDRQCWLLFFQVGAE